MLFDTLPSGNENIVIVPPKPDAFLSHHDEFSYSNLYSYEGVGEVSHASCSSNTNNYGAPTSTSLSTVAVSASATSTSNSSFTISERSSNVSFDSSAFDRPIIGSSSSNQHNIQKPPPTLRSASSSGSGTTNVITRDEKHNGAFTFQVHAEYDLLLHVQKDLDRHRSRNSKSKKLTNIQLSKVIMRSIDEYCLQKQWMYHIGNNKGKAIGRFLEESLKMKKRNGDTTKFTCVDLGTYCGYSSLVLATTLCQFLLDQKEEVDGASSPFDFHIYTTEVSTKLINVAQSIFRLANMEAYVTPIFMKNEDAAKTSCPSDVLSSTLREHGVTNIDFLLLDHDKSRYLSDLQDLEQSQLLRAGSYVSADNVVFNRLDAYRDHMRALALEGVVESRLEEMNLEYSNNLKDGLEMTKYLKDPPHV